MTEQARRPRNEFISAALIRGLWLAMLVAHLPALFVGWQALVGEGVVGIRPFGFLGLNLSTLFFLLKIFDVSWLRFETDRRSLFVLMVAVVFLHAGVVNAHTGVELFPAEVPLAATVAFASGVARVQRLVMSILYADEQSCRSAYLGLLGRLRLLGLPLPAPVRVANVVVPRAPPC